MSLTIRDAALYRKLSEPFPNVEAADKALNDFFTEFRELRIKHKIPDAIAIVAMNILTAEGDETTAIQHVINGDSSRAEQMIAWSLGQEQRIRQENVGRMMSPRLRSHRDQ